jgi:hypothetical protein
MRADKMNIPDPQKFKQCVNMALMLQHVSLAYINRAEDEARRVGRFRLDVKQRINKAIIYTKQITDWTDSSLMQSEAFYNSDLSFLDRLMQLLIDNVSDSEKQGYLLDFIASGYQLPSELPEVVKSLRTDIMELMAARANDKKEIEKLQGENTLLIQQINRL